MIRSAIVVLILALGVAISSAQPQRTGERERVRQGPRLVEELNLTDQQEAQWRELRFSLEKKQTSARAKVEVARIELKELMAADKLDRSAIEKKTREISDLQYQMKLARIDHMFAVLNTLTPEQQEKWKDHLAKPRPMMREHMRQMRRTPRGDRGRWFEHHHAPPLGELEPPPFPDED